MPALWLAQLLCPNRHAICALAYDLEQTPREEIEERLNLLEGLALGGCGLCGSKELHVEHGKLFTNDWDEAEMALRIEELKNLDTREWFHRSKN